MRAAWLALLLAAAAVAQADARVSVWHIEACDRQSLQRTLLELAQQQLSTGLYFDRTRARMSLSSALPPAPQFEIRAMWNPDTHLPALPLHFELRAFPAAAGASGKPVRAALSAPLLQDVWVAARRLRKGSQVSCADLQLQRRPAAEAPKLALAFACEIAAPAVALRDLGSGDALRSNDVGQAWDVIAGAPVRVSVIRHGISVTATATALADARVGDRIEVRLAQRSAILITRVTGPGAVQLLDTAP